MNKRFLVTILFSWYVLLVFCQGLQFQNNVNASNQSALLDNVKQIAYLLINLGLAIGAIPTAKRLFQGEPGSWKAVMAWGGAFLTANMAIALVSSYVAGQALSNSP